MAVAFDAQSSSAEGTGTLTWTHTPVGTPRAVLITCVQNGGTGNEFLLATYGLSSVAEVALSPAYSSAGDEDGGVAAYFLGTGIDTGAQTGAVTVTGTAAKIANVITLTAAADTEVEDTEAFTSASQDEPTMDLVTGAGIETYCAGALFSALGTVGNVTAGADYTKHASNDFGTRTAHFQRLTANKTGGTYAFNWTTTAADDVAMIAVAIKEAGAVAAQLPYLVTARR